MGARAIDTGMEGSACNSKVSRRKGGWDGGRADQSFPVRNFRWASYEKVFTEQNAAARNGKYTAGR